MAELEFLDHMDKIAFPLVESDSPAFSGGGALPRQGLADAGFLMGIDSGFEAYTHVLRLHSYARGGETMSFDFRSDAPGMSAYRFLFEFGASTDFGTAVRVYATRIDSGAEAPSYGEGYIAVGDLTDLYALGEGTFELAATLRVEPALLQALGDTLMNTLSVANQPRLCPTKPGSSAVPEPDYVCPFIKNLDGEVLFSEGNNSKISVDADRNLIQLGAAVGAGLGEPCEDVIIDEDCGFTRGEECDPCDEYIRSLNGMQAPEGVLYLTNGPGVVIVNEPTNHRVRVIVEAYLRTCVSSSST